MTAHLQDLRSTLECYRRASMQLRRDKCRFGYSEIEFVWHVITGEGHRPLPRLIEKIKIQERPSSLRQLKAFLGLVNYYREFLSDVAQVASPLYNLTRRDCQWRWNSECEESFCSMSDALATNAITLAYPQWDRTFFVEVDASKVEVGGVLTQMDRGGKRKPIAFFSSKLSMTQRNYSASELEAWAIVAASRKWRKYLDAAEKVVFLSDHNSLQWMRRQRNPRGKFARWIMELDSLNYEIQYRKGVLNVAADYLSRMPTESDQEVGDDEEYFERHVYTLSSPGRMDIMRESQRRDPVISRALSS